MSIILSPDPFTFIICSSADADAFHEPANNWVVAQDTIADLIN